MFAMLFSSTVYTLKGFAKHMRNLSNITKRHYEIAGAMQRTFEKLVLHLLSITKKYGTNSGNLVLAGGAAMNCVFNGHLQKKNLYKKILTNRSRSLNNEQDSSQTFRRIFCRSGI